MYGDWGVLDLWRQYFPREIIRSTYDWKGDKPKKTKYVSLCLSYAYIIESAIFALSLHTFRCLLSKALIVALRVPGFHRDQIKVKRESEKICSKTLNPIVQPGEKLRFLAMFSYISFSVLCCGQYDKQIHKHNGGTSIRELAVQSTFGWCDMSDFN